MVLGIFLVFSFFALFYKVDYSITAPAYNDNIEDTIKIPSDYETAGTFHTTSVISIDRISLLQKWLGDTLKTVDVDEIPSYYYDTTPSELWVMSRLMKDDSLQSSLIVGISKANIPITYTNYRTIYLTYNHLSQDTLEVGDYILSINGNTDIDLAISESVCDEYATFDILRDGEELTFEVFKNEMDDGTCKFGIYLGEFSEIIETDALFQLIDSNTGGPSGGLMQSLYIYNELTEQDYSLGLKIGGTGTIDLDGNVGYIGGVRQKIITAIKNDIDIFFVPYLDDEYEYDNYLLAVEALNEFDSDMILVGVSTLDEAIEYLREYGDLDE